MMPAAGMVNVAEADGGGAGLLCRIALRGMLILEFLRLAEAITEAGSVIKGVRLSIELGTDDDLLCAMRSRNDCLDTEILC